MHQRFCKSLSLNNKVEEIIMFGVIFATIVLCGVVSGVEDGVESPGLRQSLHDPPAGMAPSTLEDALTVEPSTGGSHFQKLPGELDKNFVRDL